MSEIVNGADLVQGLSAKVEEVFADGQFDVWDVPKVVMVLMEGVATFQSIRGAPEETRKKLVLEALLLACSKTASGWDDRLASLMGPSAIDLAFARFGDASGS